MQLFLLAEVCMRLLQRNKLKVTNSEIWTKIIILLSGKNPHHQPLIRLKLTTWVRNIWTSEWILYLELVDIIRIQRRYAGTMTLVIVGTGYYWSDLSGLSPRSELEAGFLWGRSPGPHSTRGSWSAPAQTSGAAESDLTVHLTSVECSLRWEDEN